MIGNAIAIVSGIAMLWAFARFSDAARIELAKRKLRARVIEHGERKSVAACSVRQGAVECATAEGVTVRVQGLG